MASHAPPAFGTAATGERSASGFAAASRPVYLILGTEAICAAMLAAALRFDIAGHDLTVVGAALAAVLAGALLLRRARAGTLATALEASVLVFASTILVGCLSMALASAAPPYRDAALAAADRWLMPFGAWPAMVHALSRSPRLVGRMCDVYATLLWQPFALIWLLAAARREAAIWRFLRAWCLTLLACVTIFALVPAVAAYRHYGIDPAAIAGLDNRTGWQSAAVLATIRNGTLHQFGSRAMTGLITFPSFHAAGAVLLGWGFARVPVIGRGLVALDVAMLLTVPLVGGHYFVDVLAGMTIAAAALIAARPRGADQ